MKKLLIIGGSGLLGANWAVQMRGAFDTYLTLNSRQISIKGVTGLKIDWNDKPLSLNTITNVHPDIIINAAGYTNVDDCERYPEQSLYANVFIADCASELANKIGAKFVQISTDHIFDGSKAFYTEEDKAQPLNLYAEHKLAAEQLVNENCSSALICRTNFIGWGPAYRRSFSDLIIDSLKSGNTIDMFDDIFFTPLMCSQLISVAHRLVDIDCEGVFNLASNERISKYEFAVKLAKAFSLDSDLIQPIQASRKKKATRRPADLSLSDRKMSRALEIDGFSINDIISELIAQEGNGKEVMGLGQVIPYGKHHINQEDIDSVVKTLKSGIITQGPSIERFEREICEFTDARYAVAVSSATAGLHLSYLALGLKPGHSILTSPITFVSTANAAHFCGASVRFADIDAETINIGAEYTSQALNTYSDIKIVAPVLFGGSSSGIPEVAKIARLKGKAIVEDAAHGLGGSYSCGSMVGSCKYSDCTVFSLHPVKSIAAGEGGVVTTNDPEIYKTLLRLRSHGINKSDDKFVDSVNSQTDGHLNIWYYEMTCLGFHYRMTEFQASLASSQLKRLGAFMKRRREIAQNYVHYFNGSSIVKKAQNINFELSANHLFVILIEFDRLTKSRNSIMSALRKKGIVTQVHYIPVVMQPFYSSKGHSIRDFPNSEKYYNRCLSIPIYYELDNSSQKYFLDCLEEAIS